MEEKHIHTDTIYDREGRIPTPTEYKTVWSKELKLLQLFKKWNYNERYSLIDILRLSNPEKVAISRHKKAIMKKLGLLKERDKIKIIRVTHHPKDFFIDFVTESKKCFVSEGRRFDKSQCTIWTEQKEELVKEYNKLKEETKLKLNDIEDKIFNTPNATKR